MNINRRGIYTIIEVDDAWRVLLLYVGEPMPKEINMNFVTEPQAEKFVAKEGPLLQKATKKAFHMAWQSQKMMYSK